MIDQLFGSKTRVKLLSLFYNNPDTQYYVREITRKIDEQINSVRRELSNLLSLGIISSENSNNRLYYRVNPKYKYNNALKSIFTDSKIATAESKEESQQLKKFRALGNVKHAFLLGYFAGDSGSDLDLFIVGDINKAKLNKLVSELEDEKGSEVNYSIMPPSEYDYRKSLNDRFILKVSQSKKTTII